MVTTLSPRHVLARATYDQNGLHVGATVNGLIDQELEGGRGTAAITTVGRNNETTVGIKNAIRECFRGEATKDDRVGGPETSAGQHGHHCFGDHRHIDRDTVAGLHAERRQSVGRLGDTNEQVGVGNGEVVLFGLTDPVKSHPITEPVGHVAIDAVNAGVESSVREPLGEWWVPLQSRRGLLVPGQTFSLLAPPGNWIGVSGGVEILVSVGRGHEFGGRRKGPAFIQ
ncbi:unannotated protein [freshwater metagenome]|uniref:Unannotated protein n=1 Tax=freshwater metagenome TaxID=449393 RepID=A0A6J6X3K6_9ZZZZ